MSLRIFVVALIVLLAGCGETESREDGSTLALEIDKRDPEPLLRFYLGSYLGPDGGDPVEAGLLTAAGGDFGLDMNRLAPRWHDALAAANTDGDGALDWDEFVDFLDRTYAEARDLPPTLNAFRSAHPYADDGSDGGADSTWFTVEIDGVMTTARRRVFVPTSALRAAIRGYRENNDRLLYPVGTAIIGEHHLDGALAETTVMQKRADGHWDFFVYGRDGALAAATDTPPRSLRAPTQCVGCHIGRKAFEPEESFPADAPDGPFGPRGIHVAPSMRNAAVTAFFSEHAKRSDTVLGVYNTLFVSGLLADRRAGRLSATDAALLEGLDLPEAAIEEAG